MATTNQPTTVPLFPPSDTLSLTLAKQAEFLDRPELTFTLSGGIFVLRIGCSEYRGANDGDRFYRYDSERFRCSENLDCGQKAGAGFDFHDR